MSSVHPFVKGKFYLKIIGRFAQKVLILVIFPPFPSNFAYRTRNPRNLHRDFRRYKSCLHADGVGEAPPPEEGAAPAAAAPNYVECEMLLGVHTMGQAGRQFTERELDAAKKVATAVGDALERSEKAIWDGRWAIEY